MKAYDYTLVISELRNTLSNAMMTSEHDYFGFTMVLMKHWWNYLSLVCAAVMATMLTFIVLLILMGAREGLSAGILYDASAGFIFVYCFGLWLQSMMITYFKTRIE